MDGLQSAFCPLRKELHHVSLLCPVRCRWPIAGSGAHSGPLVSGSATAGPASCPSLRPSKLAPPSVGGYVFSTLDDPKAGTTGSSYEVQGTFVLGINDRGQISGNYGDAKYITHGLVLSHGQYTTFDDPNAGTGPANLSTFFFPGTDAVKTNNRGQLVGFYVNEKNVEHSFLLSPHGSPLAPRARTCQVLLATPQVCDRCTGREAPCRLDRDERQ